MTATGSIEERVLALLEGQKRGDEDARRELFALLYDELRGLASLQLRDERADHSQVPTALVHEVYLKLERAPFDCEDRRAFLRLAAAVMRRTLIDGARRRIARRHAHERVIEDEIEAEPARDRYLLGLDLALEELARMDPEAMQLVELRFFLGFDVEATARALEVSAPTVKRRWRAVRAWLQREVSHGR